MRRIVLSSLALLLGGSAAIADQVVVRGNAGFINYQLQTSLNSFGSSFAERNRLADERKSNIEQLRRQLEACGDCSNRKRIEADLQYWTALNETIHTAEKMAVRAVGLEKYGDFDGIRKGLAEFLTNKDFRPSEAEKRKWAYQAAGRAAGDYCSAISRQAKETRKNRPLWDRCMADNTPQFIVLQDAAGKAFCASLKISTRGYSEGERFVYTNECLDWALPSLHLQILAKRINDPMREPTTVVSGWCGRIGAPSKPTEKIGYQRQQERWAQIKACTDKYNVADLIRQRDSAEKACQEYRPENATDAGMASIACLYEKDPLRRMKLAHDKLQTEESRALLNRFGGRK